MRILSLCLVLLWGFYAVSASAQFDLGSFANPTSGIELQPAYPEPGEQVTATIADYQSSNYGATITWTLDGKIIPDTENKRAVVITAGESGSAQTIRAVLTKVGANNVVFESGIKPLYLDIILEPQTHTPDQYQGRALPSVGSTVNATALLSGHGFRNPDLIYTWKVGQQTIGGAPMRGRNQVSFAAPMGDNELLTLQVTELNGTVIAQRSILLPLVDPEIQFYEINALFGRNKKTINQSVPLIGNSLIVRAEPYYLDSRVFNNPDTTIWKLGGVTTDNGGGNPYEITLQRLGSSGNISLEFHVRDTKQILQGAQASTRINF